MCIRLGWLPWELVVMRRRTLLATFGAMSLPSPAFASSRVLATALAQGRSRSLYKLASQGPSYGRLVAWDVDPTALELAVVEPTGNHLILVNVTSGQITAQRQIPFVGNVDPAVSLMRYIAPGHLCWPTAEDGVPMLVLLDTRVADPPRKISLPEHQGRGGPFGEIFVGNGQIILADGAGQVITKIDLASRNSIVLPSTDHHFLRFVRNWNGEPFSLETRVDRASNPIIQEESRHLRLRSLASGSETIVDFGNSDVTSLVAGLPDGRWALASGARMLLAPGEGSQLRFASADGQLGSRTTISRPFTSPTSLVSDGAYVFITFLSSDQSIVAYDLQGRLRAKTPSGMDAHGLIIRGGKLFHVGGQGIGVFETA